MTASLRTSARNRKPKREQKQPRLHFKFYRDRPDVTQTPEAQRVSTEVYGAADLLQQAGELRGLQTAKRCLVLRDPLVQVRQLALDGILYGPLPRLQLRVLRISNTSERT